MEWRRFCDILLYALCIVTLIIAGYDYSVQKEYKAACDDWYSVQIEQIKDQCKLLNPPSIMEFPHEINFSIKHNLPIGGRE